MKKSYGYIPLWFLLVLPPLVLFTLLSNFMLSGISLIVGAILLKIKNPFDQYYRKTFSAFMIISISEIICFIFYMIPELLRNIEFFDNNLVSPLEYNPYKKILSFIYMILLFIIIIIFIYKSINKYILNDINDSIYKIRTCIIMTLFLIPYLFFLPSTFIVPKNKSNLDDFKGTLLSDKTSIKQLLGNLNVSKYISSYVLQTDVEPYTLHIYLNKINKNYIKFFEIDSATIFMLIKNINEVKFHMNDTTYTYDINKINDIFDDIKKKSFNDLQNRYNTNAFKNYIYFGRLNEYDVFDINNKEFKNNLLYDENNTHYYLNCSSAKNIFLYQNNKKIISLKMALIKGQITTNDLKNSELEIILTGKEEKKNENINK